MHKLFAGSLGLLLFAALPSTTTYKLNSYGFGSGGGTGSTSTYAIEGNTGQLSGTTVGTTTYKIVPTGIGTQQAHVPKVASFDNNSGVYYNKLHFVIDTQSNPTDTTYAVGISTDNFASDKRYVKSDLTVGATLTPSDFQTYAAWGGSGGANIIGLSSNTTYYVRISASQGKFTQSPYGPSASAATANPSITFNLTTSSQATPPFSVGLGTLTVGSIGTTTDSINLGLTTNAASGASLYILSKNGGLKSVSTSSTINSASADLGAVASGYGAQSASASQSSGGPLSPVAPYAGSSNLVGIVDSSNRSLYTSPGPIASGVASLFLKAKAASTVVAANDYSDIVIIVAAGSF